MLNDPPVIVPGLPTDRELDEVLQRAGITHCLGVPYPWVGRREPLALHQEYERRQDKLREKRNSKREIGKWRTTKR